MKRTLVRRFAGALLLTSALAVSAALPATAAPANPLAATAVSADVMAAMQRDLHLTADQVRTRFAQEDAATAHEATARRTLGDRYAGAWFNAATGRLVVQTTDLAAAAPLRGTGVEITAVSRSSAQLDAVKAGIDALAGHAAPAAITGWYVDTRADTVVVTVNRTRADAATRAFLAKVSTLDGVVVREVTESPRTLADIVGAYPYYINNAARCSIGFTVTTGFVSAGHCGNPGDSTTDSNGAYYGSFAASYFPGHDYSYVRAASGVNLYGYVYGYPNYYYVHGSTEVPVGSSICRSGSTTGMHCGSVQAKNQTVNYSQGTVYGLTQTNVCAEPGDSGGSWLSNNQAQGVTSGGSGDCTSGGTTYFQPVNPILAAYGLSLVLT